MAITGQYGEHTESYVTVHPGSVEKETVYIHARIYTDLLKGTLIETHRYALSYDLEASENVYSQAYTALKLEDSFTSFTDA